MNHLVDSIKASQIIWLDHLKFLVFILQEVPRLCEKRAEICVIKALLMPNIRKWVESAGERNEGYEAQLQHLEMPQNMTMWISNFPGKQNDDAL